MVTLMGIFCGDGDVFVCVSVCMFMCACVA